jgi:hypothetical protein
MDVSDAYPYPMKRKKKNKGSQMGHTIKYKKTFKKKIELNLILVNTVVIKLVSLANLINIYYIVSPVH